MSAFESAPRQDMYDLAGEQQAPPQHSIKPGNECQSPREPHHLTPRELAWRPDPNSQSESAKRWRTANSNSRHENLKLNADGIYVVTGSDSLSTIAERSLRERGNKLTGKSIQDEMSRIVALNRDAYPEFSRNLHLVKHGMQLRMRPDNCTQKETGNETDRDREGKGKHTLGAEGERADKIGKSRRDRTTEEAQSLPIRHGNPHRSYGYGREDVAAYSGGSQILRMALPMMAGLFGNTLGGQRFLPGGMPWRHGMTNEMLGYNYADQWDGDNFDVPPGPRFPYSGRHNEYYGPDPRLSNGYYGPDPRWGGSGRYERDTRYGYNQRRTPWTPRVGHSGGFWG